MTRDEAIHKALDVSERHDAVEDRLLQLKTYELTTGLKDAEKEERDWLWGAHDLLERETIDAYAQLHTIDPGGVRPAPRGGDAVKGALLIGLDRAIQVLGPFGSQPSGVPKQLRIPKGIKERIAAVEESQTRPLEVVNLDRTFLLVAETRDYWIYEEVWS
jgi:hypothetical protein